MGVNICLSSPLTISDWLIKSNGPDFGIEGIRTMLTRCKQFGFTKIYWRVFEAGCATYSSKLAKPFSFNEMGEENHYSLGYFDWPDQETLDKFKQIDFQSFDSLKAAISIGHELNLEIHAWLSINEDDHGVGWQSEFTKDHPEFRWIRRDGRSFHSQLSYAFPEVREYKLGLLKEILDYDIDGVFLDWIRTGDIRDNPQNDDKGVVDYGYEQPNIEKFQEEYGISPYDITNGDQRWIKCRAEPVTEFMRQVRKEVSQAAKRIPISIMVQHLWSYRGVLPGMIVDEKIAKMGGNIIEGSLNGLLCDIKTWAKEGLIDEVVAAGYYTGGGTPEKAYNYIKEETEGLVPVWLYGWVPNTPESFTEDIELAERLGAKEILFWEADYIDSIPPLQRQQVMEAIEKYRRKATD
ncbi:family 10 glycosylhydrolase [Paenibacillus eucommiae]|uniref:Uncharacterized lipoprotein YddW (UPF0748 family) n=1 Tax=Paenibacillus eucommiae TaxID=1355755 RepID=A0ABS4ITE4_9BACL|nr:family 10 glycosylhydrolase [Paenibacillus eucommiae]MBP1990834.1 uncharacterized lipoprotein YddW (UPF0748 family) [Paenibacillus eucommiae]